MIVVADRYIQLGISDISPAQKVWCSLKHLKIKNWRGDSLNQIEAVFVVEALHKFMFDDFPNILLLEEI